MDGQTGDSLSQRRGRCSAVSVGVPNRSFLSFFLITTPEWEELIITNK